MFKIVISEESVKKINKMDKWLASTLTAWMQKEFSQCVNPRKIGKSLFKKDNRFWQYRLGDLRLLALIHDDSKLIILTGINYNDTLCQINPTAQR